MGTWSVVRGFSSRHRCFTHIRSSASTNQAIGNRYNKRSCKPRSRSSALCNGRAFPGFGRSVTVPFVRSSAPAHAPINPALPPPLPAAATE